MAHSPAKSAVTTRTLTPEDAVAVAAMAGRCGTETLYRRFLGRCPDPAKALAGPIQRGAPAGRVDI